MSPSTFVMDKHPPDCAAVVVKDVLDKLNNPVTLSIEIPPPTPPVLVELTILLLFSEKLPNIWLTERQPPLEAEVVN